MTFRVLCSRLHTHFDRTQDETVQVAGDADSLKDLKEEVVDLTTDSRSDTSVAIAEESTARDTSIGAFVLEDCAALPTDSRVVTGEDISPLGLQVSKPPHLWSDNASEDGASTAGGGDRSHSAKRDPIEQQDPPSLNRDAPPKVLKLSAHELQVKAIGQKLESGLHLFNPGAARAFGVTAKFEHHIASLPLPEAEEFTRTIYSTVMELSDVDLASMLAQKKFREVIKIE